MCESWKHRILLYATYNGNCVVGTIKISMSSQINLTLHFNSIQMQSAGYYSDCITLLCFHSAVEDLV